MPVFCVEAVLGQAVLKHHVLVTTLNEVSIDFCSVIKFSIVGDCELEKKNEQRV
jgi:hypothetical protein